jgi:hypothetical protein
MAAARKLGIRLWIMLRDQIQRRLLGIGDGRKVFLYLFDGARFSHRVWRFSEQGELPVCPWLPVPGSPGSPGSLFADSYPSA